MARLFIKHKPVSGEVEESVVSERFYVSKELLLNNHIDFASPRTLDVAYVCAVSKGKCWAARYFTTMGNKQIRITCHDFSNTELGQQMILADMILN